MQVSVLSLTRIPSFWSAFMPRPAFHAARLLSAAACLFACGAIPRVSMAQDGTQLAPRGPHFLLASSGAERVRVDVAKTAVLRHRLSVNFDSVSLGAALAYVAREAQLDLAYSNAIIPIDKRVALRAENITVAAALTELLLDVDVDVLFSNSGQAVLIRRSDDVRKAVVVAGSITGRVTDGTTSAPVAGVTVAVRGTNLTAVTREDGRYTIASVPPATYTIEARRLGYTATTRTGVVVAENQATTVDLVIQTAALQLQATVITGVVDPTAGTSLPFTVGRVTKDDLPVPAMNPLADIQGKVAGVTMVPPAQPGSDVSIQLRTPTSINKSNSPLIVVDGVILSSASPDLNSLDIESIEIVKGAAGASLYGSRAASGVIQIRTARGNNLAPGTTQFTARSELGTSSLGNGLDWSQAHYYLTNAAGQYVNAAGTVVPRDQRVVRPAATRFQDVPYIDPTYDPVQQFFKPGKLMTNSFTVAQNGERTNFLTTLSRQQQDGVVLGHGGYTRTDARINLDNRPHENVQLSLSGYHARSDREELMGDPFYGLINIAPDVNLLVPDPDGTKYAFQPDLQGVNANPLYLLETQRSNTQRIRTLGSLSIKFTPLSWLTFDANGSYDRSDQNGDSFINRGLKTPTAPTGSPGVLTLSNASTSAINA